MTPTQVTALRELRHEGYAVCIFTPEELKGVNPKYVEGPMCERGFDVIDSLEEAI